MEIFIVGAGAHGRVVLDILRDCGDVRPIQFADDNESLWVLGFFPVWILGVVDYQGSRLVGLRRVVWPTSAAVIHALDEIFKEHGKPVRILTDNGSILRSAEFEDFLAEQN